MNTLDNLPDGQTALIESIEGGATFISRVSAMGFTPGAKVLMIKNRGRGPLITWLRDTQVALGRGQASRIFVRRNS